MLISAKSAKYRIDRKLLADLWRISKKLANGIIRELIKWLSRKLYEVKNL